MVGLPSRQAPRSSIRDRLAADGVILEDQADGTRCALRGSCDATVWPEGHGPHTQWRSAFSTERTQAVAMLTIDAQVATLAVAVGSAALGASVGTLL